MPESFEDRTVLVTGACGGIGEVIVRQFAAVRAQLAICDVREGDLVRLAEDLKRAGADIHHAVVDVTDESQVQGFCRSTGETFGGADVLINTVGIEDMGDVETLSTENWTRSIATNLTSAFLMAKHAVPLMKARGGGVIVNVSSVSGLANQASAMVYSVTKAGLISLTKSEAIDLAPYGIRAVAVCPGSVSTPLLDRGIKLTAERLGRDPAEQRRDWESQYPSGRFSTPAEVADLILFLSSGRAGNITGTTVVIDGGLTAVLPER